MIKPKVLFLCSGNSCRTQIAEASLRDLAGDRFEVKSAGGETTPLDPVAVEEMRELGIDISACQSKSVNAYFGERVTFLIPLCDRQRERTCPIFPGAFWRQQWNLENPAAVEEPAGHRQSVRRVRDQFRQHVTQFVSEHP
jgi:arsenate reductase